MKATDVMGQLVARFVAAIENGADSWTMPWRNLAVRGWPRNAVTGQTYRGGNTLALHLAANDHGYPTNQWATYRQWESAGAQVRKGGHGTRAIRWVVKGDDGDTDGGRDVLQDCEKTPQRRIIPVAFTVFNAAQVEGGTTAPAVEAPADDRLASWLAPIPARVVSGGNRAYYSPTTDTVHMPTAAQFIDIDALSATVAHELAHWSGHTDRLARTFGRRYGDDAYAVEELTAELSAAFTCAELGINTADRSDDHAGYLASWCRVLSADPGVLWTVAGKAQAASDFLAAYSTAEALVAS